MTPLERRYRRLLRLLPPDYRERREEEMVETFLLSTRTGDPVDDEVVDEVGHPGWQERWSVLVLALRSRLGGGGATNGPRRAALGAAVRWWVTSGLLVHAVLSLYALAGMVVREVGGSALGAGSWQLSDRQWLLFALECLWIPAFGALLWGRVRVARAFAVLALCVGVLRALSDLAVGGLPEAWSTFLTGWVVVAVDVALVLGLAAFPPGEPPPDRRSWSWAATGLAAVVAVVVGVSVALNPVPILVDQFSIWWLASLGAAIVVWWCARVGPSRPLAERYVGLALLCLTTALLRMWLAVTLLVTGSWSGWSPWLTGALLVQLVTPVVIGVGAAVAASRRLRTQAAGDWRDGGVRRGT